jgi:Ca-activated chloride channel family protein
MHFANPEAFGLLALLPLALWQFVRTRRGRGAAQFSSLGIVAKLPLGWAVGGTALLVGLRVTALVLLIAALARPQTRDHHVRTHSDGIAIQLVIDNSASMEFHDYELDGQSISRLDAVKHAVRLFVAGGESGIEGRPNDKIGIITFARDPDVACPATLDHDAVLHALDRIQLAPPVGTNIGDGLAWALDRIYRDPTKQKVVILLSDGSHNARDPSFHRSRPPSWPGNSRSGYTPSARSATCSASRRRPKCSAEPGTRCMPGWATIAWTNP